MRNKKAHIAAMLISTSIIPYITACAISPEIIICDDSKEDCGETSEVIVE